jgi:hypothetical protein
VAGCCENGNEPSDSIKRDEFLHYVSDCWLVKISAVWS